MEATGADGPIPFSCGAAAAVVAPLLLWWRCCCCGGAAAVVGTPLAESAVFHIQACGMAVSLHRLDATFPCVYLALAVRGTRCSESRWVVGIVLAVRSRRFQVGALQEGGRGGHRVRCAAASARRTSGCADTGAHVPTQLAADRFGNGADSCVCCPPGIARFRRAQHAKFPLRGTRVRRLVCTQIIGQLLQLGMSSSS